MAFYRNAHSVSITEKIVEEVVYVKLHPKRAEALFNPQEAAAAFKHLYFRFVSDNELFHYQIPAKFNFTQSPSKSQILVAIARFLKNQSQSWVYVRMPDPEHVILTTATTDPYSTQWNALRNFIQKVISEQQSPERPIVARGGYGNRLRGW